ncbi:efflux RND transporter periplasmic adaptor subunit [Methylophaga muralis]|uniref:Multidrug resistance protein MdtA n=1 Tax=Methylophaga muralis TaxID=291169 RepID=A0A1E3GW36_9GAMM|nr:efflux RND transporter periplasmic adaptor subunit [Methylophaga muralis]ODN67766.1 Multidrug resistance protein MdtA precursor [Methylophaga muralis]
MPNLTKTILVAAVIAVPLWFYVQPETEANIEQPATAPEILSVRVAQPQSISSYQPLVFNSRVEAIEQSDIFARADGYVESRHVDIGDEVKQGDLLAKLSSPELEQEILQAKAEINRQKAMLDLTEKVAKRYTNLRDSGAVNATEVDEKEAELAVAKATLATYQARLEQLENEFAYTEIVAPFDGIITRRLAERGNRITRNDAMPLFRISRTDQLRVIVDIPQTQLFIIDQQQAAQLTLPDLGNQQIDVPISRVSREVNRETGTMRVEYLLENAELNLPAGLSGELAIQVQERADAVRIPVNALKTIQGKPSVMLVNADNQVEVKTVRVGRLDNSEVEILSGLITEDRVILNPNARLAEGVKVTVSE